MPKPEHRVPPRPKIFHISHLDNLRSIADADCLWSDARRIQHGLSCSVVGMGDIKRRRLERLDVKCHRGLKVGACVPFYFCPRSIMLFILHKGNHPAVDYRGGQEPIVHLVADLHAAIAWADRQGVRWAFSDRNAGAEVADFFSGVDDLPRINWPAVQATDFRDPLVKEGKQAEFLIDGSFPWALVEEIGVFDQARAGDVAARLAGARWMPPIVVRGQWYY